MPLHIYFLPHSAPRAFISCIAVHIPLVTLPLKTMLPPIYIDYRVYSSSAPPPSALPPPPPHPPRTAPPQPFQIQSAGRFPHYPLPVPPPAETSLVLESPSLSAYGRRGSCRMCLPSGCVLGLVSWLIGGWPCPFSFLACI